MASISDLTDERYEPLNVIVYEHKWMLNVR